MVNDLLQGKPLRHPLHSAMVHIPLGLFFFSFALDLGYLIFDQQKWLAEGALYTMALGVVTALLAAVPGFVDYSVIRGDHPAKKTATAHMVLNLLAVMVYGFNLGVRYLAKNQSAFMEWLPFLLSVAGVGLLSLSGYLGGKMVFDDGIGVGRHRRRTKGPDTTVKAVHQSQTNEGTVFSVAKTDRIQPGETLRVDAGGHVLCVANVDGDFCAFQEFCTHRYGPLSEGPIKNGQVECPWHRSCFDVKSGKVTKGPAKTDLRTYRVEIKDQMILVEVPIASGDEKKQQESEAHGKGESEDRKEEMPQHKDDEHHHIER